MTRTGKKQAAETELGPLRAIGEALQRNYRSVSEEKIPDSLLNLLEQLGKTETKAAPGRTYDLKEPAAHESSRNPKDDV